MNGFQSKHSSKDNLDLIPRDIGKRRFGYCRQYNQGLTTPRDPWGNPFQYLKIEGRNTKGVGKLRKDRGLVPVNSDFDLYSKGRDGKSQSPFTSKASQDDIVRANNGRFIGLVSDY